MTALQRYVSGLAATACNITACAQLVANMNGFLGFKIYPNPHAVRAGAYVAGGAGAAVVGGLLAGSQLPQLRAVLEAEPLATQLDARALLRLLKAFLQARTIKSCSKPSHKQRYWPRSWAFTPNGGFGYARSSELMRVARPVFPPYLNLNPGVRAGELRAQQRPGARRAPGVRAAARRPLRARVGGRAAILPGGAGGRGQRRGAAAGLRAGQHAEPAVWHAQGDQFVEAAHAESE